MVTEPYRRLPSTDFLLERPAAQAVIRQFGRVAVRNEARRLLEESRRAIAAGQMPPSWEELTETLVARVQRRLAPTLRPVLNATGVIIHTNLGRAPLAQAAQEAMLAVAAGYSALEYDLNAGTRGSRYVHAERLLCELSGAEAALVVNNNAAAVTLVLRVVAAGREVIISRGELVEIGGGFRVPEILAQSGARLVEVGTTNRTRLGDYRHAVSSETAAFLKVHPSNFRLIGFTEAVELADLVDLGRSLTPPRPVINDLGSGTFLETRSFGLAHEPMVPESVAAGAIATTFSGDKLLGGPQAGLIVGDKALIAELREHPLARAIRPDKLTLAALQATLLAYLRGTALQEIPVWQMIAAPAAELETRARNWADRLNRSGLRVELRPGYSAIGGGSLPGQTLPTTLLALLSPHPDRLVAQLRHGEPPVVTRIEDDTVLCDPRTILPGQDELLVQALRAAWEAVHG